MSDSHAPFLTVRAEVGPASRPRLDIDLHVGRPEVVGVVGPNGAGKSTLLRSIAGLEGAARSMRVTIGGTDVSGVPIAQRHVAYVPQAGGLFPHLSVLANVAYGLRAAGVRRAAAHMHARRQLETLAISELADRSPSTLSGGQAQRVAIARALAIEPKVLLLDEPTASLDAASRVDVRSLLRRHLATFPGVTVLVTHDASEVLTLADRVIVLERGRVVQDADSDQLVRNPQSAWLAEMLRLNAWRGTVTSNDTVTLEGGGQLHAVDLPRIGAAVLITASPTAVAVFAEPPGGSIRNVWRVSVDDVAMLGDRVRLFLTSRDSGPQRTAAEITRAAAADLGVEPGSEHFAALKATELSVSIL
ncbi:MAG: ABC transporter ATP-binding protein [Actinomycetes bacterium]